MEMRRVASAVTVPAAPLSSLSAGRADREPCRVVLSVGHAEVRPERPELERRAQAARQPR